MPNSSQYQVIGEEDASPSGQFQVIREEPASSASPASSTSIPTGEEVFNQELKERGLPPATVNPPSRPQLDYMQTEQTLRNPIAQPPTAVSPEAKQYEEDLQNSGSVKPSDVAGLAYDVLTNPEPGAETGMQPLGPQLSKGIKELETKGKRTTGALRVADVATEGMTPVFGPAMLESLPETIAGVNAAPTTLQAVKEIAKNPIVKGLSEGLAASKGSGYVAGKAGATPEQKQLVEDLAFWAPGVAHAVAGTLGIDNPKLGVQSSPEGTGVGVAGEGGTGAVVAVTPEEIRLSAKFKGGAPRTISIPRGGAPAPAIEPPTVEGQVIQPDPVADASRALSESQTRGEMAARVAKGEPAVPAPQPPAPEPVHEITPDDVAKVGSMISQLPPEMRGQAIVETHGTISRILQKQGKIVGPDGKIEIIDSPKKADLVAQKWINDEVARQDDIAAKDKTSTPTHGEVIGGKEAAVAKPPAASVTQPFEVVGEEEPHQGDISEHVENSPNVVENSPAPVENSTNHEVIREEEPQKEFKIGDRVQLPDGRNGEIQWLHPRMRIARVRTEAGPNSGSGKVSIGLSQLKPATAPRPLRERAAKEAPKYKFASTQANLPAEASAKVVEAGKRLIPDSDLAADPKKGDTGREDNPHVTVKYGVEEDSTKLRTALAQHEPFDATLGKLKVFPPTKNSEGRAVVVAEVHAPQLHDLHKAVHEQIGAKEDDFQYSPHVTLAYIKPEAAKKYDGSSVLEGTQFPVRSIALTKRNGTQVEVPLGAMRSKATPATKPVKREDVAGKSGSPTTLNTPSSKIPAHYKLVEAGDLVPSHNAMTFTPNEKYPAGVQERAYHTSKEAQARVIEQTQKYDPSYTVNTNPDAVNGPPVVTPDGTVLGGNSRTMSTQRLYGENKGDTYRKYLRDNAANFGYSPEEVDAMRQPVLVRQIAQPETIDEMRRLGSELNKSMTGSLSVEERAVSAGKNIKPETLSELGAILDNLSPDATLRDLLREHPKAVLRLLEADGAFTARERPQFVDTATGGLNEEGKTFIERALLGSVVDDPRLMQVAPKSVLSKLESSLAQLASLGGRTDAYNILPLIRMALAEHSEIAQRGSTVEDYLGQKGLFAGDRDPATDAVIRKLAEKRSDVNKAIREFAADAHFDHPGQATLGIVEPPSASRAFNAAFGTDLSQEQLENSLVKAAGIEPIIEANNEREGNKPATEAGARGLQRESAREASPSGAAGNPPAKAGEGPSRASEELKPPQSLFHSESTSPIFYSKAERVAAEKLPNSGTGSSMLATLRNAGVKEDEIKWIGLDDYLRGKLRATKDEVLNFIRENQVRISEVSRRDSDVKKLPWLETKGGSGRPIWVTNAGPTQYSITKIGEPKVYELQRGVTSLGDFDTLEQAQDEAHRDASRNRNGNTRYSAYTLPGPNNDYTELLLTLPGIGAETSPEGKITAVLPQNQFKTPHFEEPNILAHVRFDTRKDADGNNVLFLEEVQSDWHQKGKKVGYASPDEVNAERNAKTSSEAAWQELKPLLEKADYLGYDNLVSVRNDIANGRLSSGNLDPRDSAELKGPMDRYRDAFQGWVQARKVREYGVPDAPFKTDWHELVMKRMLRFAAEHGFDRLGWTTGEQQAQRYDLSKHIESINWQKNADGTYDVSPINRDGSGVPGASRTNVSIGEVADLVGKDVASKIESGVGKHWSSGDITQGTLEGIDLKVGGEWAKALYDRAIPNFLNKYGKKWDAKVSSTKLRSGYDYGQPMVRRVAEDSVSHVGQWEVEHYTEDGRQHLDYFRHRDTAEAFANDRSTKGVMVHSIDVTPEMQKSVLDEGQPLFSGESDDLITGRSPEAIGKAARFSLVEPGHGLPKYVRVNAAALSIIHDAIPERSFLGVNFSKEHADDLLESLAELAAQSQPGAYQDAVLNLRAELEKANDNKSGLSIVRQGQTPEQELAVIHEELFHSSVQRRPGEGQLLVPYEKLLNDPGIRTVGERISGYEMRNPHPLVVVAEGIFDIFSGESVANGEVSPEQAEQTVKTYFQALPEEKRESAVMAAQATFDYVDELAAERGIIQSGEQLYDAATGPARRALNSFGYKRTEGATGSGGTGSSQSGEEIQQNSEQRKPEGSPSTGSKDTDLRHDAGRPPIRLGAKIAQRVNSSQEPSSRDVNLFRGIAPSKAIRKLYEHDVEPTLKRVGIGIRETAALFIKAFYPRIEESNPVGSLLQIAAPTDAADALMKLQGDRARALDDFDAIFHSIEKMFDREPEENRIAFIDRMQTGEKQPDEKMQQIADAFRRIQSAQREEEELAMNLRRNPKFPYELKRKENYFNNHWKTKPGSGGGEETEEERISKLTLPRRPLEGSKSFNKQQHYTLKSGIAAGGVPVTTNPVRLLRMRIEDGMKLVTAHRAMYDLQQLGLLHYVKRGMKAPDGFDKIDDRIAKVYFPASLDFGGEQPKIEPHELGEWYVEANTARLLNNMLSRDLIRSTALGRSLMFLKNASTAIELGLSPFHAVFETIEAASSQASIGLTRTVNQGIRQGDLSALREGLKDIISSPVAPITLARDGAALRGYVEASARLKKIGIHQFGQTISGDQPRGIIEALKQFRELRKEKSIARLLKQYPDLDQLTDDMYNGGFVMGQHHDYEVRMLGKTAMEALTEGNPIGALWRAVPTILQGAMKPLFEWYIPSLKYSLFLKAMSQAAAERSRELEDGTLTRQQLARQVADSIENRLGEMNFDSLFLNRTTKTALQFAFRSVTWKLGSMREFSGAVGGQARELGKWAWDAYHALGGGSGEPPNGGKRSTGAAADAGDNYKATAIPRLDPRMAWIFTLLFYSVAIGSIAARALSGKWPWEWTKEEAEDKAEDSWEWFKQLYLETVHARTGEHDSRGKPVRIDLPTYLGKDVESFRRDPARYFTGSLSGIVSNALDVAKNQDYFGNYVYNPHAGTLTKAGQIAKHMAPSAFIVSNYERAKEAGTGRAGMLGAFGFPRAPVDLDFTPAERLMRELTPHVPETPEEVQEWQQRREALEKGQLGRREARAYVKAQREEWLVRGFKRLPYADAIRVYNAANDDEKSELHRWMREKRRNLIRKGRSDEVREVEADQ